MNKQTLERLIAKKKQLLSERLKEYNRSLSNSIETAKNSQDYENIASTCVRYSTVIARLEAEIGQLQELFLYIEE